MRGSLVFAALVAGVAPGEPAQLRADAAVAVAADGSLEQGLRASSLEEATGIHGTDPWQEWTDPVFQADPTKFTQWKPRYMGCLQNVSMSDNPAAGRVAAKKISKMAVFDFFSCKNFCGTHAGVGDMIGLSGMHECYCLQYDWLPPYNSGFRDIETGLYNNPVRDVADWEKLSTMGNSDACDACTTQTMTGCMLPSTQLPCPGECEGECDCETCYGHDHNHGKSYKEYCDKNCANEGTRKCGGPATTDATGLIPIPNRIAVYKIEKEVANVRIPPKESEDCHLNKLSCHHHTIVAEEGEDGEPVGQPAIDAAPDQADAPTKR